MVNEAVDDPWSSARFHLGASQGDALVRDTRLLGLVDDWSAYLKGKDGQECRPRYFEAFVRVGQQGVRNA